MSTIEENLVFRHAASYYHLGRYQDDYTLCGVLIYGLSWDAAETWGGKVESRYGNPKCPYCQDHPDLPLWLLGGVA